MYQCINTVIYIDLRARQECDSLATVPRYVKRMETVCLMAKLSVMTTEDTQLPQKTTRHFCCTIGVELKLTFRISIKLAGSGLCVNLCVGHAQYSYKSEHWLFCLSSSPKMEISPIYDSPLCRWRTWWHYTIHITFLEFSERTSPSGSKTKPNQTKKKNRKTFWTFFWTSGSPIFLKTATLTPCFQSKYSLSLPREEPRSSELSYIIAS